MRPHQASRLRSCILERIQEPCLGRAGNMLELEEGQLRETRHLSEIRQVECNRPMAMGEGGDIGYSRCYSSENDVIGPCGTSTVSAVVKPWAGTSEEECNTTIATDI